MFSSSILRAAKGSEPPPFDFENNPFKAKRVWPPDFQKLSEKHQFRLERRYRRRSKLKWLRPQWMAATKLAQWGICSAALVYFVLWMDWGDDRVFRRTRAWYKESIDSIFMRPKPPPPKPQRDSQQPS